jgi:heparinase II/III-like protein
VKQRSRRRLYLDTARHLRARQIAARPRRLLPPALLAVRAAPRSEPRWQPVAAALGASAAPQSGPLPPPHDGGTFVAVGARRAFGSGDFWQDSSDGLLFLFHLHGFEPLAVYAAGERTATGDAFWERVIASWLEAQTRPRMPAWHPYPTSSRLIAWSAAISSIDRWSPAFRARIAAEVWRQGRYLRRTVEHDIGGNHVVRNAVGLAFAGAVLPESGLFDSALTLLEREVARQILADGGHEERSTSYHRELAHQLAEVAELAERTGRRPPEWLVDGVARTSAWQAQLTGPDCRLPLLNDAWEGPSTAPSNGDPLTHLAESGYMIVRHADDQMVFDAGPISAPHLPAHAHADVLSFVLWADRQALVVDPGSYAYSGEWRNSFRSTAAHNTVEVDGRDQCVFWGDFRAAFPPRVRTMPPRRYDDIIVIAASHDGYRHLEDPVEHRRSVIWCAADGIVIIDVLAARREHRIRSALHLAPQATSEATMRLGPFELVALGQGANVKRRDWWYAPYIGTKVRAAVLEDSRTVEPETPFGWSFLRAGRVRTVERHRVVLIRGDQSEVTIPLPWS